MQKKKKKRKKKERENLQVKVSLEERDDVVVMIAAREMGSAGWRRWDNHKAMSSLLKISKVEMREIREGNDALV